MIREVSHVCVLIRQTGNGNVFMWNEHRLLFRLWYTVIMKIENTETCVCNMVHVTNMYHDAADNK